MTERPNDERTPAEERDAELDDLDTETVEDLDPADDAEDVQGGTSLGCRAR